MSTQSDFGYTEPTVYPGELRGYRFWIRDDLGAGGRLHSFVANSGAAWPQGPLQAGCHPITSWQVLAKVLQASSPPPRPPHAAPAPKCQCGIYAFHTPELALGSKYSSRSIAASYIPFGVIAASGNIIPGTKGFRAERARIVAVVANELPRYPDVKLFPTVDALVEAYPPQPLFREGGVKNQKCRIRCIRCGWRGVRTDHVDCECYDIWTLYCRPMTPGPGCPRGINYPCPQCRGPVTDLPTRNQRRTP